MSGSAVPRPQTTKQNDTTVNHPSNPLLGVIRWHFFTATAPEFHNNGTRAIAKYASRSFFLLFSRKANSSFFFFFVPIFHSVCSYYKHAERSAKFLEYNRERRYFIFFFLLLHKTHGSVKRVLFSRVHMFTLFDVKFVWKCNEVGKFFYQDSIEESFVLFFITHCKAWEQ